MKAIGGEERGSTESGGRMRQRRRKGRSGIDRYENSSYNIPFCVRNLAKEGRPKWQTADTLEDYWEARKTLLSDAERAAAWEKTATIVQDYSNEMVKRWNGEIDALLTYAALFSAILTAFNVESYQLLKPSPPTDPVIVALETISAQLSSFSITVPSVNSTQPAFVYTEPSPTPATRWAVWLNAFWFSSLIFSLSAASIGIMVKQWLTEYQSGVSGTERQTARLRQLRLNSLRRWRVKEIVSILPVLLQIASGLFFTGLLILLWNLNRIVAIVGSVFVGILAIFTVSTIILPSITPHCSYLSPPSRVLFKLTRPLRKALYYFRLRTASWLLRQCGFRPLFMMSQLYAPKREDLRRKHPRISRICNILFPRDAASTLAWRGMEGALVSRCPDILDSDMVATAYTTAMDTDYLARYAAVCTTELTLDATRTFFQQVLSANIAHWGTHEHAEPMRSVHPCIWSGALISLMDVSASDDRPQSTIALGDMLQAVYDYIKPHYQFDQSDALQTRLLCADFASIVRHYDHAASTSHPHIIARSHFFYWYLPTMVEEMAEANIGNDVRQYVASTFIDEALSRLDGTIAYDQATTRALKALPCIISCVPRPGCSDYIPEDPQYQRWRTHLSDAFSRLLSTPRALEAELTAGIYVCFDWLLEHGESAGLLSPELMRAIISYLEAYETQHLEPFETKYQPLWSPSSETYLERLIRKLADMNAQNPVTAIMVSILGRTEGPLSVDAASLTDDDNIEPFFYALRRIIRCLPPLEASDCKPDDPVYKAVLEKAVQALNAFSDFLAGSDSTLPGHEWWIDCVFDELREHGERTGLITAELRHAIVRYREGYLSMYQEVAWYSKVNEEWIQKLMSELDDSAQNADISSTTRIEDSLPVNAPAPGNGTIVSVAVAPQPAHDNHDAHFGTLNHHRNHLCGGTSTTEDYMDKDSARPLEDMIVS